MENTVGGTHGGIRDVEGTGGGKDPDIGRKGRNTGKKEIEEKGRDIRKKEIDGEGSGRTKVI